MTNDQNPKSKIQNPMSPLTVHDIGELGLLARLGRFCSPEATKDDAALLSVAMGRELVVTTDVLVDGVHFSDRTTRAEDAGWRATAANLSDLAAMGAQPLSLTVGLSLPATTPILWVEGLYQGIADCLAEYGGTIIGGDLCRSSVITVSITALGEVVPHRVIRRSAALPDQAIVATGMHGSSRAGLELLLNPATGQALSAAERTYFIRAHQHPRPRLDVAAMLATLAENDSTLTPLAGMDSSDGLANAVCQICQTSGVGARLVRSHLPIPDALVRWVGADQALDWSLYGGEDFELVLCLPLDRAKALVKRLGKGAAIIGMTTASTAVMIDQEAGCDRQYLSLQDGFQHF